MALWDIRACIGCRFWVSTSWHEVGASVEADETIGYRVFKQRLG